MTWQPTLPRGPVGGSFSSPGPVYRLPGLTGQRDHDIRSVHAKAPAYQFGDRIPMKTETIGPGPCYNFQNQKVYRDGKDGTPQYSLHSRAPLRKEDINPAPNRYFPEKTFGISMPSAPKYSFRPKHDVYKVDNHPAPNSYTLPPVLGRTIQATKTQAPIYSMKARRNIGNFDEDLAKTPGPCAYQVKSYYAYLRKPPAYTLHDRTELPMDMGDRPGPSVYRPEKSWPDKKRAPGYSFGIRHSQYTAPLMHNIEE